MLTAKGIANNKINETPIAVVDLETTGLRPGFDRVVEISVFKKEPGKSSYLAFDTLVNPKRPVSATEIHGITDEDVKNAPTFDDIAGDFVDALSGCVIAAYNVYFDIKFLERELKQTGVSYLPPYFCLMYMRPLLNLGHRCNLETACHKHGINFDCRTAHIAASDAEVSAKLMEYYLDVMSDRKISTFGQLSHLKSYKFLDSFRYAPLPKAKSFNLKKSKKFLSRAKCRPVGVALGRQVISECWDSLRSVLADLDIPEREFKGTLDIRRENRLPKKKMHAFHTKAFASVISRFISDKTLDYNKVLKLKRLSQCLSKLGWVLGE